MAFVILAVVALIGIIAVVAFLLGRRSIGAVPPESTTVDGPAAVQGAPVVPLEASLRLERIPLEIPSGEAEVLDQIAPGESIPLVIEPADGQAWHDRATESDPEATAQARLPSEASEKQVVVVLVEEGSSCPVLNEENLVPLSDDHKDRQEHKDDRPQAPEAKSLESGKTSEPVQRPEDHGYSSLEVPADDTPPADPMSRSEIPEAVSALESLSVEADPQTETNIADAAAVDDLSDNRTEMTDDRASVEPVMEDERRHLKLPHLHLVDQKQPQQAPVHVGTAQRESAGESSREVSETPERVENPVEDDFSPEAIALVSVIAPGDVSDDLWTVQMLGEPLIAELGPGRCDLPDWLTSDPPQGVRIRADRSFPRGAVVVRQRTSAGIRLTVRHPYPQELDGDARLWRNVEASSLAKLRDREYDDWLELEGWGSDAWEGWCRPIYPDSRVMHFWGDYLELDEGNWWND